MNHHYFHKVLLLNSYFIAVGEIVSLLASMASKYSTKKDRILWARLLALSEPTRVHSMDYVVIKKTKELQAIF
jgi:hypothetical protein